MTQSRARTAANRWRTIVAGALLTAAAALSACGGGSTVSGSGASLPGQAQTAGLETGKAVIVIPAAPATTATAVRKAQFVSASVASVGIVVNGGAATFANVSATSSLCVTTSSGRSCTIPLSAPAGSITFAFTLYDGANGSGNVLGTGTATQTVVIGTPYTISVAVNGTIASLAVSVPAIDVGPTSEPVTVTAKDADGNTIIGPATYAQPITLTNSDTTGTLALSTTTIASPNTTVTLAYTGGTLSSAATIAAASSGVPASASSPAAVLPLNYFPVAIGRNYALSSSSPGFGPTTGTSSQGVLGGATFGGFANVQAITQTNDGFMGVFGLNGVSTAYAAVVNGTYQWIGFNYQPTPTVEPPAISLGPPYGCSGVTTTFAESQTYTQGYVDPSLPFSATPTAFVAAYTGTATTTESAPVSSGPACGGTVPPTITDTTAFTQDASGNYTAVSTYGDGSTMTERDNADGSGSLSYTAGTTAVLGTEWENGMNATWQAAGETVSAPSGGNVTIAVSQTTPGGTQTSSGTLPTATMYPNGVPSALWSGTSSAGAPVSSLPSSCDVTAAYSGPVIPVTLTFSRWEPVYGSVTSETLVDYLAPAIGIICELQTYNEVGNLTDLALASQPISLVGADTTSSNPYTESDSLTSLGPPGSLSIRRSAPTGLDRLRVPLTGPRRAGAR
jgi:hypothetical protein